MSAREGRCAQRAALVRREQVELLVLVVPSGPLVALVEPPEPRAAPECQVRVALSEPSAAQAERWEPSAARAELQGPLVGAAPSASASEALEGP